MVTADLGAGTSLRNASLLRSGELTVFLTRTGDTADPGPRTAVVTLAAPAVVALDDAPPGWRWDLGRGLRCDLVDVDGAAELDDATAVAAAIRTVEALGELLRESALPPAEQVVRLQSRPTYVAAGRVAVVDDAAWASPVDGNPTMLGVAVPETGAPLPPRLALPGGRYMIVSALPIDTVPRARLLDGLAWLFQRGASEALRVREARRLRDTELAQSGPVVAAAAEHRGVRLLAAELATKPDIAAPDHADPLVACTMLVGAHSGLTVTEPEGGLRGREGTAAVRALAMASHLYVRRVSLLGRWWERATSAVLGFTADGRPVALLPAEESMVAVDADGTRRALDETVAATLIDAGFVLSQPLVEADVGPRTLLARARRGRGRSLLTLGAWGGLIALLGLAVPRASGIVFGEIIPESDRARMWALTALLITVALATLPLQLVFSIAKTRLEAPASFDVQRSLWGRVLRSPATTIQSHGVGDVTVRLQGLENVRGEVDSSMLAQIPALLSGLLAGAMLFYYDISLAVIAIGVGLVCLVVSIVLALVVTHYDHREEAALGVVNGFVLQVLLAIPKLRVAAAESRAFLAWAERFRDAAGRQLMQAVANQALFAAMIQTIGMLVLLAGVSVIGPETFDVGTFMAFQTTYVLFLAGVGATVSVTGTAIELHHLAGRAAELASAPLEAAPGRTDPGPLRGAVALAGVTFRYQPNTRPVLDDLSLRIEPGEMVAIAGPSGCGKSTIVRMLVGFEVPEQGSVLYDDQDLTSLDVEAIRRQLGVVLQGSQLTPGTVRENIAGVATIGDEEVWELAALAALDEDIRAMPMGLDTLVTVNGGAFSGGQRQRLAVARALASHPRILVLDEATSALDNVTQRVITTNLAQLGMTRIVIAHRLSTMVDADRILVVEAGRIVEQGDYTELMARRGRFYDLASRQVLEEPT